LTSAFIPGTTFLDGSESREILTGTTCDTKVSQVVPVRISLDSEPSKNVVPGMNAEVKIHKVPLFDF
jgi:hypothetical protein